MTTFSASSSLHNHHSSSQKTITKLPETIGVLGGGQLGRMFLESANRLNIPVHILDVGEYTPAKQVANTASGHIDGSFRDSEKIRQLASKVDVLTFEIEHVDAESLLQLDQDPVFRNVRIEPSPVTIQVIQDKYRQKVHLQQHGLPLSDFAPVTCKKDVLELAIEKKWGFPMMLKSKTMAYDGKGNYVIRSENDIDTAIKTLSKDSSNSNLYVERWVPFTKELAVMVARNMDGSQVVSYPTVETIHQNSILHLVCAPAQIDGTLVAKSRRIAEQAVATFQGAGVFGVEMFLLSNGEIVINEIAPRPHNSGHYTIEACHSSQFEQHLRCIMGLPLGSTAMRVPYSVMLNIIGAPSGDLTDTLRPCAAAMTIEGASVHLYGKTECRAGRKMGHITLTGSTVSSVHSKLAELLKYLPGASSDSVKNDISQLSVAPVVGIIMGSDSDLPTMKPAAVLLKEFGVPFEITIVSAHRTPDRMMEYAKQAHLRGIQVIIAAAGGAAHLPGMVAAITPLPVIGVPVQLKTLDGVDSLYSIVQMPRGVPVATVAINNSTNAALLAIRILGAHIPEYLDKMMAFQRKQEQEVMKKVDKLESIGWEGY